MSNILPILIVLALLSVVGVLIIGIISMIKGGEFNKKYSNKLMQMRIILQVLTILLLALSYFLAQS